MKFKEFLQSLTFKFSLAIILVILFTSLTIGFVIFQGQKDFLERELHKKGIYLTRFLSEQLIEPLLYEEKFTLYKLLEAVFNAEPDYILFAEVFSLEGEPLVALFKEKPPHTLPTNTLRHLENLKFQKFEDHYEILGPVIAKNYGVIGYLRIGISYKDWKKNLGVVHKKAFLTVLFITLIGILIALFITRKIIHPAQERMLRAEKLSALGQFAAGLAHEIKNPLTSLKMLLQGSLKSNIPLERTDLEIMEREIERIDKIVKDFLNFSRVNKKIWLPIDLKALFDEIESLCRKEFERGGVEFRVETSEDNLIILGDSDGIKQVLFNLLINAYQALNGKPGKILLRAEKSEKKVKIIVEDNGEGIPEEIIPKIFDPFFTTKPEGTGMGLAIVNSIVREHKGEIKVFSEVGRGTKIEVILPLRETA